MTSRDDTGSSPLHLASSNDFPEIARLLIEHGADVTSRDGIRSTPLHWASSNSSPKIARLLIEHGADLNARDRSRSTPLHLASTPVSTPVYSEFVSIKTTRLLLRRMADVKEQRYGFHSRNAEMVQVLLEHGADVASRDDTRSTPLHLASSDDLDLPEIVRLLIEHGADVTSRDGNHSTPLHLASLNGASKIGRLLIEHGADANAQDRNHNTPLCLALSSLLALSPWQLKTMWLLIESDVPVYIPDRSHHTCLRLVSSKRSSEIARLLFRHLAHVETRRRHFGVSVKTG